MRFFSFLGVLGFFFAVLGCSGVQTFPNRVAPGETVGVAAGWKHNFARNNITATITPSGGSAVVITPDRIRASINLYPDPLASLVLSNETGTNISPNSGSYPMPINTVFSGDDADWWQTTVFIDIPDSGLPPGLADLTISNPQGESVTTSVRIVDPDPSYGGSADVFDAELAGPLADQHLTSLERVDHYVVSFSGSEVPYAVQLDLAYADLTAYVVNPRGLSKSLSWTDNTGNSSYRVLLMPSNQVQGFRAMTDLKFYVAAVAGTQATASLGVVPGSVQAFDQNGDAVAGGVAVDVSLVRGAAGLN
jgi:hypothetical protein